jgi:hypothetical protein
MADFFKVSVYGNFFYDKCGVKDCKMGIQAGAGASILVIILVPRIGSF